MVIRGHGGHGGLVCTIGCGLVALWSVWFVSGRRVGWSVVRSERRPLRAQTPDAQPSNPPAHPPANAPTTPTHLKACSSSATRTVRILRKTCNAYTHSRTHLPCRTQPEPSWPVMPGDRPPAREAHALARTGTRTRASTRTHARAHTHTKQKHTHTHTQTHTHTHTETHTLTQAQAHSHMHSLSQTQAHASA